MKAIICNGFGGREVLTIGEYSKPTLGDSEVLVKVHATALNRADIMQREGKYPPPAGASPILGLEMSGEVIAIGADVSKSKIGDRVCALLAGGGYAEYSAVHEDMLMPIPEDMGYVTAAGIPEVFLTAYQALVYLAKLKAGERILIHAGASGVGTAAIQIAKAIGAEVYTTASAGKHHICNSLGSKHDIDYKSQDFENEILDITDGNGVNVILDFLAASYFQKNINSLSVDGRMVMLATMGGIKVDSLDMGKIVWKRLKIMGSTLRARPLAYKIKLTQDFNSQFWSKFLDGTMRPIIDSEYDWNEVQEAHLRMESNQNAGKIILKV